MPVPDQETANALPQTCGPPTPWEPRASVPQRAPAGILAVIEVLLQVVGTVSTGPGNTTVPFVVPKFFPVITTWVPAQPVFGVIEVISYGGHLICPTVGTSSAARRASTPQTTISRSTVPGI